MHYKITQYLLAVNKAEQLQNSGYKLWDRQPIFNTVQHRAVTIEQPGEKKFIDIVLN